MVEKRKTCTRGKCKQPCRKIKKSEKDPKDENWILKLGFLWLVFLLLACLLDGDGLLVIIYLMPWIFAFLILYWEM